MLSWLWGREKDKIDLPLEKPVLAVAPQPPPVVEAIRIERPVRKEGSQKLQYLKIDPNSHKVWCSCGQSYSAGAQPVEANWWVLEHLVKGCHRPEAQFEKEFAQAAAGD